MRIGSLQVSTHAAGMSALWHDTDYLPEKRIHTPTVERGLEELPLPSEQHQLPPGVEDPFRKLDDVYAVAADQMERGLEGRAFLHGRPPPASFDARVKTALEPGDDVTRTLVRPQEAAEPRDSRALQDARASMAELDKRAQAGNAPPKVSNATEASDARQRSAEAQRMLEMAEGLGVSIAALAVGQAIDPAGALGATASSAASAVKAVSTANTAVGLASAMQEEPAQLRRGLQGRRRAASLDPDDEEA